MTPIISGSVLIATGILAMFGSALNWWVVTRPGKLINRVLGDTTARVIYFGIGIFTFVKGIELAIGARWLPF